MVETFGFSEEDARRILRLVRQSERGYQNLPAKPLSRAQGAYRTRQVVRVTSTATTSGRYPGQWQTYDSSAASGARWTDSGFCWIEGANRELLDLAYYMGDCYGVLDDGYPVFVTNCCGGNQIVPSSGSGTGISLACGYMGGCDFNTMPFALCLDKEIIPGFASQFTKTLNSCLWVFFTGLGQSSAYGTISYDGSEWLLYLHVAFQGQSIIYTGVYTCSSFSCSGNGNFTWHSGNINTLLGNSLSVYPGLCSAPTGTGTGTGTGISYGVCNGYPATTDEYLLTATATMVNGTCSYCTGYPGAHYLVRKSLTSGLTADFCTWRTSANDLCGFGTNGRWEMVMGGNLVSLYAGGSGNSFAVYQLAGAGFSPLGSNTLTLISSTGQCTGWPENVTVEAV